MPTVAPPTRRQRRDAARRERLAREAAAVRRRRLTRLGAVLGAAAAVVAVLVAVSASGSGSATTSTPAGASVNGARETSALLAGIPQHGLALGDPKAPVRIVEFADLQCPFCRDYSLGTMPRLIRDDVRTGKVRMEFQSLAFIGPDSERAARVAQAAAAQNKLWNFVDLAYRNQGRENSGWASDAFLRALATAVPGLDVRRVLAQRDSAAVTARLDAANALATRSRVSSTPTFLVGRGTSLKAVDAAGLPAAIRAALAR
jgi:protein-disulfide isomerase